MSCLFEPIHGRFPTNSICDSYPDCVGCSYSDPFKQSKQTNADKIRNMTDEELAETITADWCSIVCPGGSFFCDGECKTKVLDWLRQEAET